MRNLLITLKLLLFIMVLGQDPVISSAPKIKVDSSQQIEIDKTFKENEQKLEEIRLLKLKNDAELNIIKQLNLEKKAVDKSNIKLLDKLLRIRQKPKIIYVQNSGNVDMSRVKIDSVCISTSRTSVFGRKKCNKWEYFKYLDDPTEGRITIK